ncbi:MAG: hypothetical protein QM770_20660 [Tepidisphaeraceae bacterium]
MARLIRWTCAGVVATAACGVWTLADNVGAIIAAVPTSGPSTMPAIVPTRPADPEAAAAFDLFEHINQLCRDGKADEAAKLVLVPKKMDVAEFAKELADIGKEQSDGRVYVSIDARSEAGVSLVIIGKKNDEGVIKPKDALGVVQRDGVWKLLAEEPEDFDHGELTPGELKAFDTLNQWAVQRMVELRGVE